MGKKKQVVAFGRLFFIVFFSIIFCGFRDSWAIDLGKTYDKSNVQEIRDLLFPQVLNWVVNDGWVLKTGKPDYEIKLDHEYLNLSNNNEGRYEINDAQLLVLKGGGGKGFVRGLPFPTIDVNHPRAGQMIMENIKWQLYRSECESRVGVVTWVGLRGKERETNNTLIQLFYQNRRQSIRNPSNFLYQEMVWVTEPFDLRGTVTNTWNFDDAREDSCFAYVPMLRRVRRVSAATRSDPFLGSDMVLDDTGGWAGKNTTMTWKFIGKKTLLMPMSSMQLYRAKTYPDGSMDICRGTSKLGYEDPNWQGVPWAPLNPVWTPRPVWIVQGTPKDPYYNFGLHQWYVDADLFACYFKICYDRAGLYWRTYMIVLDCQKDDQGSIRTYSEPLAIDDKNHHCTITPTKSDQPDRSLYPISGSYNPGFFTEANMRQLSK